MPSQEPSGHPSPRGLQLLKYLYGQQRNGKGTVTFLEQDEDEDGPLKELNMSFDELKRVVERLRSWRPKKMPPFTVGDVEGGFQLSILPDIGCLVGLYKRLLQHSQCS